MRKSFLSKYHVNEVPFAIKPIFYLYGYGIAFLAFLYFLAVHMTSKIEIIGEEKRKKESNYILCFWHTNVFLYFAAFLRNSHQAWMQHPKWYMKPSHVLLKYLGVRKIVLGSSGHSGKKAAGQLVHLLRERYSTVLLPDGPAGPPFEMKKGALHISMQSNVPILPIIFKAVPSSEFKNWDRRKCPMLFSKITVMYGEPIQITRANFKEAHELIAKFLG